MTHQIDVTRGQSIGTVSAQWARRPDDQKFLDLSSLKAAVGTWRRESSTHDVKPADMVATVTDSGVLKVNVGDLALDPTHYGFGQVAGVAGAPAGYLRSLPAPLAALNLNYGFRANPNDAVSAYVRENGTKTLRAITSTSYGRIFDEDVVDAVMKIAGNGTGDMPWKVPGCIDWGGKHGIAYNPRVEITKESTTLYASDRDLFLFLVDDLNPIEVGKLSSGAPDLMFRGFWVGNSEVGSRKYTLATMYLRGVCQNRNLWGVEGFKEIAFNHTSGAPARFLEAVEPALISYAKGSTAKVVEGVKAAKSRIVSRDDEERIDFLAKYGFSATQAKALIGIAVEEEGRPQESVWDHAQAITAQARASGFQDRRLHLETLAGKMLDKVAA